MRAFYLGQVGVERRAGAQDGFQHGGGRPEDEEILVLHRDARASAADAPAGRGRRSSPPPLR